MGESQNWLSLLPIAVLILLGVYLSVLFTLRFIFKIKRDYTVEGQVQKRLPVWLRYVYIILLIGAMAGYFFFDLTFGVMLLLLLGNQVIISTVALKILEDKNQKYYHYSSVIFNSLGIIGIVLIALSTI